MGLEAKICSVDPFEEHHRTATLGRYSSPYFIFTFDLVWNESENRGGKFKACSSLVLYPQFMVAKERPMHLGGHGWFALLIYAEGYRILNDFFFFCIFA